MKDQMPRIKLEKFRFDWWIAVFISATFAVLLQLPIANAQQKPRQQQSQNQNSSDQGSKKSLTAARGSDGSDGSRVSLTSNSALSDYSAYRSGNRFYVIIPNSKVPVIKGALKGKGYEDV